MPWRGWDGALVAAAMMVGAAAAGSARAAAVDCWLLDGERLEQAVDRGLCDDAFSRNSKPGEAPVLDRPPHDAAEVGQTASLPEPPSVPLLTPPRKPKLKPAPARTRAMPGGPHRAQATPVRATRQEGGGFLDHLQRDLGALGDLLEGQDTSRRRRAEGAPRLPSHNGR